MRVLVIGGAGFVGSNLANHFLKGGNDVTVLDNLSRRGTANNLKWLEVTHGKKLNFINADIRNFESIRPGFKDIDVIFHTAAQVAVTTSVKDPRLDFDINALGTFNVLEAARLSNSDPRLVFTSTNKVYGNNVNDVSLSEGKTRYSFSDPKFKNGIPEWFSTDANEHTPYGVSKYSADLYVRDYFEIFGLKTVTFRMSCIYGTRQFGNEDQGWVAHFVISSIFGRPLTIFGDGKQVRDVLFIDDLVRAFELASSNIKITKGKAYNIGGGVSNTISLLELLTILKNLGHEAKVTFSDWRPADQKVYISDVTKAAEFGWKPKISPEEGVNKLAQWITANKALFS